jgi:hypothetical protein
MSWEEPVALISVKPLSRASGSPPSEPSVENDESVSLELSYLNRRI